MGSSTTLVSAALVATEATDSGSLRHRRELAALRATVAVAVGAPVLAALAVLQLLGGPLTLICAALMLAMSTAVLGRCHGRLALARAELALARGRYVRAAREFGRLTAEAGRVAPSVAVRAYLGRAELEWSRGQNEAAGASLRRARGYLARLGPAQANARARLSLGLHALACQLACVDGRLEDARRELAGLAELASEAGGDSRAATQLWLCAGLVGVTAEAPVGGAPQRPAGPRFASASELVLDVVLRAWRAHRRGDESRSRQLLGTLDGRALALLQQRWPRLADWASTRQLSGPGYR